MMLVFIILVIAALVVEEGIRKHGDLKTWIEDLKNIEE